MSAILKQLTEIEPNPLRIPLPNLDLVGEVHAELKKLYLPSNGFGSWGEKRKK